MTGSLCFIDCETTGLDPDFHEIWEVAVILRPPNNRAREDLIRQAAKPVDATQASSVVPMILNGGKDVEYVWQLPVDLARADPMALNIGRFMDRRGVPFETKFEAGDWTIPKFLGPAVDSPMVWPDNVLDLWCQEFARLTWGAHMLGMVPSFDTDRLWRLLRRNGACPGWHYQPVDVEAVAAGYILGSIGDSERGQAVATLPWDSENLGRMLGIDADGYARHSALGDCRWARDLWDAIQEGAAG